MKVKLFSVYDSKVKAFRYPFFMQATGAAIRGFMDLVNDGKSEISKYPADFTLFEHGSFDDETGMMELEKTPLNHGVASVFKNDKGGN